MKASDLVIAAGARLNELTSQGYTLFDIPVPQMKLVHAYPGAEELGRVYHAASGHPCRAARRSPPRWTRSSRARAAHDVSAAHQDYLDWSEKPLPQPGDVNLSEIMVWLRGHLPADAILCNGAGNYAGWIHRFYRFRKFNTQIGTICGFMGYGVPAAVAMKSLYPERTVLAINGDGDFLMNGQEFATAMQYKLPIICAGAGQCHLRHHPHAPGARISRPRLGAPTWSIRISPPWPRASAASAPPWTKTADFAPAFIAAEKSGLPSIIHVKFDAEGITPTTTLSAIREKALKGLAPPASASRTGITSMRAAATRPSAQSSIAGVEP